MEGNKKKYNSVIFLKENRNSTKPQIFPLSKFIYPSPYNVNI
jgi:hypothetical protein